MSDNTELRSLALAIDPNALEVDAYPWPLDAAHRVLAWLRENGYEKLPCDGGCDYNTGPEETCSRHGRPVREVWDIAQTFATERDAIRAEREPVVVDDAMVEWGARAAYENAFLRHAPEEVDSWDDLAADNVPAAESWRAVARAVLVAALTPDGQEAKDG